MLHHPGACFVVGMNKLNAKPIIAGLNRARRPGSGSKATRLPIRMKPDESWVIPMEKLAAQKLPRTRTLRLAPQKIEISLMRSVAASALSRTAGQWGR
jgi:hypothetical protein